jgi:hypothetical protein
LIIYSIAVVCVGALFCTGAYLDNGFAPNANDTCWISGPWAYSFVIMGLLYLVGTLVVVVLCLYILTCSPGSGEETHVRNALKQMLLFAASVVACWFFPALYTVMDLYTIPLASGGLHTAPLLPLLCSACSFGCIGFVNFLVWRSRVFKGGMLSLASVAIPRGRGVALSDLSDSAPTAAGQQWEQQRFAQHGQRQFGQGQWGQQRTWPHGNLAGGPKNSVASSLGQMAIQDDMVARRSSSNLY